MEFESKMQYTDKKKNKGGILEMFEKLPAQALAYAQQNEQRLISLIEELTAIPAPSHHEHKRAAFIRDTFHPLLAEMEGCAMAQVCLRNGVGFAAVKSVSDHLFSENQAAEYFDFGQALENLGAVVLPLARALKEEEL